MLCLYSDKLLGMRIILFPLIYSFSEENKQLVNLLTVYFQLKEYLQNDLFIECSFQWIIICWQSLLLNCNHCWVTGWLNPDHIPSWSEAMENNRSTHNFSTVLHWGGGGTQIKYVLVCPFVSYTFLYSGLLAWQSLNLPLYVNPGNLKALGAVCYLLLNKSALTNCILGCVLPSHLANHQTLSTPWVSWPCKRL